MSPTVVEEGLRLSIVCQVWAIWDLANLPSYELYLHFGYLDQGACKIFHRTCLIGSQMILLQLSRDGTTFSVQTFVVALLTTHTSITHMLYY